MYTTINTINYMVVYMNRNKEYFIYEITCHHPDYFGMKYIGSHYGYTDDEYKGSGKMLKRVRKSIGDKWFTRKILEYVYSKNELIPKEDEYLQAVDAKNNPNYFNLTNTSADWALRISHAGLVWAYHSDTKEQRFFKETSIPMGWIRGLYGTKGKVSYWRGKSLPKKVIDKLSNEWEVIHPDGTVEIIQNMMEFCRKNGLNPSTMSAVARGKRSNHKGYSCKILVSKRDKNYIQSKFISRKNNTAYSKPGKLNPNAIPVTYRNKEYECISQALKDLGVHYYKFKKMLQEEMNTRYE